MIMSDNMLNNNCGLETPDTYLELVRIGRTHHIRRAYNLACTDYQRIQLRDSILIGIDFKEEDFYNSRIPKIPGTQEDDTDSFWWGERNTWRGIKQNIEMGNPATIFKKEYRFPKTNPEPDKIPDSRPSTNY